MAGLQTHRDPHITSCLCSLLFKHSSPKAKQTHLQETHETRQRDTPEPDNGGPRRSKSENDRDSESSGSESDFNDKKAQSMFDHWMVSLPALNWKTLAVLLMESFRNHQKTNVTDAAKEAASITSYNEKTVRQYRKEFFTQKGSSRKASKANTRETVF